MRNTIAADVNEILLGFFLLPGNGWSNFADGANAKAQLEARGAEMDQADWDDQVERARAMADAVRDWAAANGYAGDPVRAWWTARPGDLARAVGYPVDSRKNPTDTLIQFSDGKFLGLSAKSTKSSGDIGFKNPGLGTIEKALNIDLNQIYADVLEGAISQFDLPLASKARKAYIRENPEIQEQTNEMGLQVMEMIRDDLAETLNAMSDVELKQHLLDHWLDAGALEPRYIKVTGHGRNGNYHATITDPINNPKLEALSNGNLEVVPVGTTSIGIKANDKRILKMRLKFESEKLASSIKLSGDPW